jgi:hypothetical protein
MIDHRERIGLAEPDAGGDDGDDGIAGAPALPSGQMPPISRLGLTRYNLLRHHN